MPLSSRKCPFQSSCIGGPAEANEASGVGLSALDAGGTARPRWRSDKPEPPSGCLLLVCRRTRKSRMLDGEPTLKDRHGCCLPVDDFGDRGDAGARSAHTVAAAISRGRRASLIAAAGCTLGIVPHLVAAITGLAALLYASSLASQTLKYVGVACLFFLAWKAYRDDSHIVVDETAEIATQASAWSVIVRAVLISLLNPKLTIFFIAFLPQFVRPHEPDAVRPHAGPRLGLMLVTLLVFAQVMARSRPRASLVLGQPRTVVGVGAPSPAPVWCSRGCCVSDMT